MTDKDLTSFGDVRAFFHGDHEKDRPTFQWLYARVLAAYNTLALRDAVEREWLPYILRELEEWDDDARHIWEMVEFDEDAPFHDRFFIASSPVYAMIRKLTIEEWSSLGPPEMLLALAQAPDLDHITMLVYPPCCKVQPQHLEKAFDRLAARPKPWRPRKLDLYIYEIDASHLTVLARQPVLEKLEVLELPPTAPMTSQDVLTFATSPRLTHLEHFIFGDDVESLHYPEINFTGVRQPFLTPRDTLLLLERLPDLEMLLTFEPEPSTDEIRRRKARPPQPRASTYELLLKALLPFKESHYPLDRSEGACGGYYAELDAAEFEREGDGWVTDTIKDEIATLESWAHKYVLGTPSREGGLESAFDEQGILLEPIIFYTHCQPDHQRTFVDQHPNYQGQYFVQTVFAQNGLVLFEDQDTHRLILLPDAERPERSHLTDIFDALRRSEMIYNGLYADYLCTFEDGIVGRVSGERVRGTVSWRESRHQLDAHGNLSEDSPRQEIQFNGDILPFRTELRRHGLDIVPHSSDEYTAYIQVRSQ